MTYGGGIVGGDLIELAISLGAGCYLTLLTTGSTKVFKAKDDGLPSRQYLDVNLDDHSFLAILPEPVTCFADSLYQQKQRFHLQRTSSLVLLDWYTAGRKSRGEQWIFQKYYSENKIDVEGSVVLRDSFLLEKVAGKILGVGRYSCYATLILIGPRTSLARQMALDSFRNVVIKRNEALDFIWCCSELKICGGIIIRAGSLDTETMRNFIKEKIAALGEDIGDYFGKI